MAHHFYDESSFPFSENFQPLDDMYNGLPPVAGQTWAAVDDWSLADPSFYTEYFLPADPLYLQSANSQNMMLPEALQMFPITTNASSTTFPTSFEFPSVLPYHSQDPTPLHIQQEESLQSHQVQAKDITTSTPKKPVVAIMPAEWRGDDKVMLADEDKAIKKRRMRNITPVRSAVGTETKQSKSKHKAGARSLEDCMGLFDSTLTVTKETRRRKAFTAQEKKAVQSVRNIGACIPCRFRKKTCSAGIPCPFCTRYTGSVSLGAQLCHRESPFIDRSVVQYYCSTSRKRVTDFQLLRRNFEGTQCTMSIDGIGSVSSPLTLKTIKVNISSLANEDVNRVLRTVDRDSKSVSFDPTSEIVYFLDPGSLSMADLEEWAFQYSCKFSKTKKYIATSFAFGVEYARKGLPHADLVMRMSRLISLNFVIRAGVRIVPGKCEETPYRTVQAQIDTLLFQAFQNNERVLYRDLQRLIFRSAGSLSRDAIIPVCLCVWQLSRLQCMLASQITNLAARDVKRSRKVTPAPLSPSPSCPSLSPTSSASPAASSPANTPSARSWEAENLCHGLNLFLCTFEGLFRSACPLLLDWEDSFNQELLGHDEELLRMAVRMGETMKRYRDQGHTRRFRHGMGYHKEMSSRIRGLVRER